MRLQELLLSIAHHHGTTLLLVTHDVNEAAYLSDRVIVMASHPGRISGEVQLDLTRPRDRRNPDLARKESEILTLLNGGPADFLDMSEEVEQAVHHPEPLLISRLNFAI
jgi:sulfonate transport system ATP-binding protein